MSNGDQRFLIGIAGGTGSGKSTVAHELAKRLERIPVRTAIIPFDNYYRDQTEMPIEKRQQTNYDHPDSLEATLLAAHLTELLAGRAIEMPVYDFEIHNRTPETIRVEPVDIVLVEGILLFTYPTLADLFDLKIFVDTPDDVRFIRRLKRDVAERGRSMESVIDQYMTSVRPMHLEFVAPTKHKVDMILPEGGYNEAGMDQLFTMVCDLRARSRK